MGTEKQRKEITRKLLATVQTAGEIRRDGVEAEMSLEYGVSPRKAREYVDLLVRAGRVKEHDGTLFAIAEE